MAVVTPVPPLLTAHLFPVVETHLIELLQSLSDDDWERQTLAPKWKVRDVASHLLDTQIRKLSICRDGYVSEVPGAPGEADLVSFVNRLNADGVAMYRRLSPAMLISLMELTSRESAAFHQSLDPFASAMFGVSWAGEKRSTNWFDTARELTERWHHQQQIRLAVGRPGIMTRGLYYPVLDCFMRGLPFNYRSIAAPVGARATFTITGPCGGDWHLYREPSAWTLSAEPIGDLVSTTEIPQEIAWRIFTKGISADESRTHVRVSGDAAIGLHILTMIAIVG